MIKKICGTLFFMLPACLGAQEAPADLKSLLQVFVESNIQAVGDKDWYLEVDGIKFSKKPLAAGLAALDEKLKTGTLSKAEKKEIRAQFTQNYTDRMIVLLYTYKDFLESADLDALFLDFLAQTATQKYLEKQWVSKAQTAKPTEADIDRYSNQNLARFTKLGLTAAQIREFAAMELSQTKMQTWTADEITKLKNKAQININKTVKKDMGL